MKGSYHILISVVNGVYILVHVNTFACLVFYYMCTQIDNDKTKITTVGLHSRISLHPPPFPQSHLCTSVSVIQCAWDVVNIFIIAIIFNCPAGFLGNYILISVV